MMNADTTLNLHTNARLSQIKHKLRTMKTSQLLEKGIKSRGDVLSALAVSD
jgi:hypothetical protein